jgi:CheY-like chemotaxis protein
VGRTNLPNLNKSGLIMRRLFRLFAQKKRWPKVDHEEIRKRARLLVIDDTEFPYLDLFRRDGYQVDKWDDVEDLHKLESGKFDLILLDIRGVGSEYSKDEGLGILRHLRHAAPTVMLVAYSDSDFSLEYQEFFELADATLSKRADYVDFKSRVDQLLETRFSLSFFVDRIAELTQRRGVDEARIRAAAEDSILSRDLTTLRKEMEQGGFDEGKVSLAMEVAQAGISLLTFVATVS